MDRRRKEGAEAVSPEAISPFGRHTWLGMVLCVLCFWSAAWTVIDRVLTGIIQSLGFSDLVALYQLIEVIVSHGIGALVLVILYMSAMRASASLPDKGAFAAFAIAEVLAGVGLLGSQWLSPDTGFRVSALCVPLAYLGRTAAFAVLSVNRENCRDARTASLVCAAVGLVQALVAIVTYYAAAQMLGGMDEEAWQRMLQVLDGAGNITFFASILSSSLSGMCFALLRTAVPVPTYPEKNRF